jgi:hypothetical protein
MGGLKVEDRKVGGRCMGMRHLQIRGMPDAHAAAGLEGEL